MAKNTKSTKTTANSATKALDKDIMFQKIMPALAQNPFSDLSDDTKSAAKDTPAVDPVIDSTPETTDSITPERLAALSDRLFGRTPNHGLRPDDAFTINVMENVALTYLDEVMTKFNCCRCDHCRRDVAALALNSLPPKYIVVDALHIEEIIQKIPKQDIYDALVKAVLRVRMYPRH